MNELDNKKELFNLLKKDNKFTITLYFKAKQNYFGRDSLIKRATS